MQLSGQRKTNESRGTVQSGERIEGPSRIPENKEYLEVSVANATRKGRQ